MAGDKYKVFISWSGDMAKAVALVWNDLLRDVFDSVDPFMSEAGVGGVGAGERGLDKIATKLAQTTFGIIVITQDNITSPWLNFEAGALSKHFDDPAVRVAPSLVDFERKSDFDGPLSQFQGGLLDKDGIEFILIEIARMIGVDEPAVKKRFALFWKEYEPRFAKAKTHSGETPPKKRRSERDLLDEVLLLVRQQAQQIGAAVAAANTAQTNASLALSMLNARKSLDNTYRLEPGDHVRHQRFGAGTVEAVDGIGIEALSVIDFGPRVGRKTLTHNREPMWKVADLPQVQLPEPENLDPDD